MSGKQGFHRTNYCVNSANCPEVPDLRDGTIEPTGGMPSTNSLIAHQRLLWCWRETVKSQSSWSFPFFYTGFWTWAIAASDGQAL